MKIFRERRGSDTDSYIDSDTDSDSCSDRVIGSDIDIGSDTDPLSMDGKLFSYGSSERDTDSRESDIQFHLEDPGPDITCSTRYFLRELKLPDRVLNYQAVFLHASYIIRDGRAILFTAPKQTGKSTQAALWEQYKGAEVINGDRALIRRSSARSSDELQMSGESISYIQKGWTVYGSPYCGTSGICKNKSAPLAAIVILGQALENQVRPANIGERVQSLLDGCSYDTSDRSQVQKVMDLIMDLVQDVPFIYMRCLPDRTAADALEEYLCRTGIM